MALYCILAVLIGVFGDAVRPSSCYSLKCFLLGQGEHIGGGQGKTKEKTNKGTTVV